MPPRSSAPPVTTAPGRGPGPGTGPAPDGALRVEELAERAGVTVDTVRFYQAKGLLHAPRRQGRVAWYDAGHLERLERIRGLQTKGFTLATIHRVLSGELDAADEALVGAMAGEVLHHDDRLLSLDELAERTGIPAPLLQAVQQQGLLVPSRVGDEEGYTADDVEVARAGLTLLEFGIPLPELLDLAQAHHRAMVQVARRAVDLFDAHVRQPGRDVPGEPGADRLVAAFRALLPATTTIVSHHFTRVLLEVALEHIEQVGSPDELDAVDAARSDGTTHGEGTAGPDGTAHRDGTNR